MQVQLFNRGPRRKLGRKPDALVRHQQRELTQAEDLMGILDAGFEDIGVKVHDYQVAPGVSAHFLTMSSPPPDYFSMPTLERLSAE